MPRITTAHILADHVTLDPPRLPTEADVTRDFNLDKTSCTNWIITCGFWKMVFDEFRVCPADVDRWRRDGQLARNLDGVLAQGRIRGPPNASREFQRSLATYTLFFQRNPELFQPAVTERQGEEKCGLL